MTTILSSAITSAGTYFGQPFMAADPKTRFVPQNNNVECLFSYGSGGTSVDVFLQTTHDGVTHYHHQPIKFFVQAFLFPALSRRLR